MGEYYTATYKEEYKRPRFYHGTTDAFDIDKVLLPASRTGNLREDWRKKNTDKVFLTTSLLSAKQYAKKACIMYGGRPIVYECKPLGPCFNRINSEYITDKALILGVIRN